mmetsp:Transcript_25091/g.59795  ORF Transcript_25091/g.59795 Transcript_25091/m.59795 type:complete len:204 (-) Transcript_25091:651-1262(-)
MACGRRSPAIDSGSTSDRRRARAEMACTSCILAISARRAGSTATCTTNTPSAAHALSIAPSASGPLPTWAPPAPYARASCTKSGLRSSVPGMLLPPNPNLTRPRDSLQKTTTTTRQPCCTAVASSPTVICTAPSPATTTCVPLRCVSEAAMAAGSAYPIVPMNSSERVRVPLVRCPSIAAQRVWSPTSTQSVSSGPSRRLRAA